jgi:hypothetical protein
MKDERKKIKEPFEPEDTPKPPQQIDPNTGRQRENPVQDKRKPGDTQNKAAEQEGEPHLLDEETDIDDETTI